MTVTSAPLRLESRRLSIGALVKRGVAAGAAGGAAMALFLLLVGEPSIRRALAIEAAAAGHDHGEEMFTRGVQVFGGVTAAVLYGVFIGAIFAVAFAAVRARCWLGDFRLAVGLGTVGFLSVVLIPALKYPANPPAVGDPATVGDRTVAYLTLLAASVLIAALCWRGWVRLRDRGTAEELRAVLVVSGWAAAVAAALLLWPTTPDPVTVPAQLLWRFRMAAVGGALVSWLTTAAVFGWLTARPALRQSASPL